MSRRMVAVVFLAALCVPVAEADEGPRLPKLKDFHLVTPLVEGGKAAALIVAPKEKAWQELAQKAQARIEELTGVKLEIKSDADVQDSDLAQRHAILLGNLMTNRVTAKLYCMEYLDVDAAWPGTGGYLLQTVHNPLGNGRNFISIGGSDLDGVAAALELFLSILKAGKDLAVGPLFELKTSAAPPAEMTDEKIEQTIASLKGQGYRTIGGRATGYGSTMRKSNAPGYAKLFRKTIEMLWKEMDELKVCDDVRTTKFLPLLWDIIEERKEFTPEDREYISDFMFVHAHKAPYAETDIKASPQPHGNNWNAHGSYMAGAYFLKYYPDLEIGRRLMERMDRYYKSDLVHWKVSEDCPGYGDITLNANLFYALTRPDMSYFENGNVRKAADYDMLITNNLGSVSGFGDATGLGSKYAVSVLPMAAWYYRDGGYLWWFKKCDGKDARFLVDDLKEEPPVRLLGVKACPLDKWIYERDKPRTIPIEKCFDKMSFRAGFDPNNQYLCLSGFSYGFHSHPDGNAIINFSDNGHTFLFDDGYMVPEMSEHNTVVVFRNGRGAPLPELVEVDRLADFERTGFSETSVSGYNGVRWSRNLLWETEKYFLVVDELQAEQDGEFGFQSIWRTMGEVALNGREMTAAQDGQTFHLTNLSGATQSIKPCHFKHPFGRRLVQSTSAVLKKGEKSVIANLFHVKGGDEKLDVAVETVEPGVAIVRLADETALVGAGPYSDDGLGFSTDAALFRLAGDTVEAVGVTKLTWSMTHLVADKPVSASLDLKGGKGVVEAAEPALLMLPDNDARFDLKKGRTEIRFKPTFVQPEHAKLKQDLLSALFQESKLSRIENERKAQEANPVHVAKLWSCDDFDLLIDRAEQASAAGDVTPLTPSEVDFPVGDLPKIRAPNGNVMFPTGKSVTLTVDLGKPMDVQRVIIRSRQLATFREGCGVSNIVVSVSNDGFKGDVRPFGRREEKTIPPQNNLIEYAMDGDRTQARSVRVELTPLTPKHKVYIDSVAIQGPASADEKRKSGFGLPWIEACDLDGDGKGEVLVGADDNCIYSLKSGGVRSWKTQLGGHIYQFAAGDMDGDGKGEVVVGCGDKHLYCIDALGKIRWNIDPPPRTYEREGYRGVLPFQGALKIVFSSDLDGDGKHEINVGSGNWRVYCHSHDGKLLWDECNWAHQPTCGDACDLDGDGVKEVMMGNDYASAWIYNGKTGKIVTSIGMSGHAGPSALDADDVEGDGKGDIILGDRMGRITFCFPWNTKDRHSIEVGAPITIARIADLDGDGKKETLVGSENGYLYLFDAQKELRWQKNIGETPRDVAFSDVNADGKMDLLVACEDGALHLYDMGGNEIGLFPANGAVRHVRMAELDGDKRTIEFVIACDGGTVYALRYVK